ncbi:MAG TPA: threonine synthase [Cyclobacteriaceae bacterium]|nr:threonine synthase [Cyclobacteriaceae bacterium]
MLFYSTNNKNHKVSLYEAVTRGLAPDNGLYMPERMPTLPKEFIESIERKSFREIAFEVANRFIGDDIPEDELEQIINHTIQFDAPVVRIEESVYVLELFHGPTLAFKDFGARFMSQLLGYFSKQQEKEIIILVATSGDTGSAVANGFLGVEGTRVLVLYPSGKVSEIQEKQFTTLGKNITAIEVHGTFDDCQRLVKQAFLDKDLKDQFFLTSANSINIARLIPQSFYFFYAFAQVKHLGNPVVFSVPSGNFGNITGGLMAKKMGLPIEHFIAATNTNDVVPQYLATKIFSPRPSMETISNAMDVGNPSNFVRMLDLYENDFEKISDDITGYAFTDEETQEAMRSVFLNNKYVLDPHGAIGYLGLKRYLKDHHATTGIFLETAHAGKFVETVQATLNHNIVLPAELEAFLKKEKRSQIMSNKFEDFKQLILNQF